MTALGDVENDYLTWPWLNRRHITWLHRHHHFLRVQSRTEGAHCQEKKEEVITQNRQMTLYLCFYILNKHLPPAFIHMLLSTALSLSECCCLSLTPPLALLLELATRKRGSVGVCAHV